MESNICCAFNVCMCDNMRPTLSLPDIGCLLFLIFLFVCAAGCISEEEKKIAEAGALFESAAAHYEILNTTEDFETLSRGNVRAEMAAAKMDLDEAIVILDTVSYDHLSPDDKKQFDALKTLCLVEAEFAGMMRDEGCDLLDHCQDAIFGKDNASGLESFDQVRGNLVRMKEKSLVLETKMSRIDTRSLPPDLQEHVAGMKTDVEDFITILGDMLTLIDQTEKASALIESASARFEVLGTGGETGYYSARIVRAEMAAAETDLREALRILETVPFDRLPPDEKKRFDTLKIVCEVDIDFCGMIRNEGGDYLDHCQKAALAPNEASAVAQFRLAKKDLVKMKEKLPAMEAKMGTIDLEDISPASRGDIVSMKVSIEEYGKSIDDAIALLDRVC